MNTTEFEFDATRLFPDIELPVTEENIKEVSSKDLLRLQTYFDRLCDTGISDVVTESFPQLDIVLIEMLRRMSYAPLG